MLSRCISECKYDRQTTCQRVSFECTPECPTTLYRSVVHSIHKCNTHCYILSQVPCSLHKVAMFYSCYLVLHKNSSGDFLSFIVLCYMTQQCFIAFVTLEFHIVNMFFLVFVTYFMFFLSLLHVSCTTCIYRSQA